DDFDTLARSWPPWYASIDPVGPDPRPCVTAPSHRRHTPATRMSDPEWGSRKVWSGVRSTSSSQVRCTIGGAVARRPGSGLVGGRDGGPCLVGWCWLTTTRR